MDVFISYLWKGDAGWYGHFITRFHEGRVEYLSFDKSAKYSVPPDDWNQLSGTRFRFRGQADKKARKLGFTVLTRRDAYASHEASKQ